MSRARPMFSKTCVQCVKMYLQDINDYSSFGLPPQPNSLQYVTCNNIQIHMLMNQFHSVLREKKEEKKLTRD